jgi:type IV pilus assembly protein PilE
MTTPKHSQARSASQGFTLIELMIAVGIVAILTTIAVPAYQSSVVRTHRSAAKACVSQYAQFMERYYTTNLTYVGAAPGTLGCTAEGGLSARYTLAVDNVTATTYRAKATPLATWAPKDPRCGTLTLNQAGTRIGGSGSAADNAYCW